MSLNDTASAQRVHIGFFGVRNAGKSSLVNAVTGQETALVSEVKGTTTDPVKKAMELLPLGPVVVIDTPGIDDEGELGELRAKRARRVLNYTDAAVLVLDAQKGMCRADRELTALFEEKHIPYALAYNKADLLREQKRDADGGNALYVSAKTGENIRELKELIARIAKQEENPKHIAADLLAPGDVAVLVVPIDSAAPKGRLILPQQQTIRDLLDAGVSALVTRESELKETLAFLKKKPGLVITDSQVFGPVSKMTPPDIPLTSFSILFVRYRGDLNEAVRGAAMLDRLKDGDTVLIAEGCTHHRQCDDIGTVKLPRWIREYVSARGRTESAGAHGADEKNDVERGADRSSGGVRGADESSGGVCGVNESSGGVCGTEKSSSDVCGTEKSSSGVRGVDIRFEFSSGMDFPEDLSRYALIVHCGGCMLNGREMQYRVRQAVDAGVPITNYGIAIAQMHGILRRSLGPFPEALRLLDGQGAR